MTDSEVARLARHPFSLSMAAGIFEDFMSTKLEENCSFSSVRYRRSKEWVKMNTVETLLGAEHGLCLISFSLFKQARFAFKCSSSFSIVAENIPPLKFQVELIQMMHYISQESCV